MKICFWGTYRKDYSRNAILKKGLRLSDVQVAECHEAFLQDTKDNNEAIFRAGNIAASILKLAIKYWRLAVRFRAQKRDCDFIFVGYIGHHDVFLAKIISLLTGKRLVFDPFISLSNSIVNDRKLVKPASAAASFLRWLDRAACGMPDIVLFDTLQHKAYFEEKLTARPKRSAVLYLGVDDSIYYPRPKTVLASRIKVLFYGYFVPLQGAEYIVEAAYILKDEDDVYFRIIGRGQEMPKIRQAIGDRYIRNIEFVDRIIKEEELADEIAEADICLGIFGGGAKTTRVIPNKVFQCLAMKKPVITADTPAVRELFRDRIEILLCRAADAASIVAAIRELKKDGALRAKIASGGYDKIMRDHTAKRVGEDLKNILEYAF